MILIDPRLAFHILLLHLICAVVFMLCSSAEAQQSNKPAVVAFVRPGLPPDPFVDAFRQALGDLGHIEEKTVHIEYRWLAGRPDVLPSVAKELKNLNAAVIVTQGEVMTRPISDVTSTIPIVMATSGDPVGAGLVTSLAKPGGNVTGLSSISPDISGKRLQLLKEAAPNVSRVAVLYNPEVLAAVRELQEAEKAARALALTIQPIKAVVAADLPPSFDVIETQKSNALFVQGDPFSMTHRKQILEFATTRKLPVISIFGDFAEAGALMSYGPSRIEMFKRAALFVDKILKGARPSDLPIEQPTKLEFIVNLKTAKQLGLRIPPNVLARADKVIR